MLHRFLNELRGTRTQADVAASMGLYQSQLSRMLQGKGSWSAAQLAAYLDAVAASPEDRLRALELATIPAAAAAA